MATVAELFSAEEIAEANGLLTGAAPTEILRWGVERFGSRLTMATAFGPEGCILIHMLAEIQAPVRIFNLDTGYQFPETLEVRDRLMEKYGVEIDLVSAEQTTAEYEAEHGGPLYVANSDRCCHDRKIVPLDHGHPRRAVGGPGAGEDDRLGRQVRPGEGQSAPQVDAARRLGLHRVEQDPL